MKIFLNGKLVDSKKPVIQALDYGFMHGDGIYETLRIYRGKPFLFQEHMRRLQASAKKIFLNLSFGGRYFSRAIQKTLAANRLTEARVRITISRGVGPAQINPFACKHPTLCILAVKTKGHPPERYHRGVGVVLVGIRRNSPQALNPAIKSTNFLNNILARMEVLKKGAFEGLMLNLKGQLAECTLSNFFLVQKGVLKTPALSCGLLPGVTRQKVLDLARVSGIRVKETVLYPRDIWKAEECFLTGTTVEVMPVVRVNGKRIGSGQPGPLTLSLLEKYRTLTNSSR